MKATIQFRDGTLITVEGDAEIDLCDFGLKIYPADSDPIGFELADESPDTDRGTDAH